MPLMAQAERCSHYRKTCLFTVLLHMFRINQFSTLNYAAFQQGFLYDSAYPVGWNGQAGKLPLWNVPTDILQSWKWVFFSSLHFYLHFLFHGLFWEEIPSGGLILFGLFVLALPRQFLAIEQCIEKACHVLGPHWISLGRAGWGDIGTPGKMCWWRTNISQLLTLLIRCAKLGLENLQKSLLLEPIFLREI